MTTHELKTWPHFFEDLQGDCKTFELRKNDRDFQVGDLLILEEYDPKTKTYTGNIIHKYVTYILKHDPDAGCAATFGLHPDYVILAIE